MAPIITPATIVIKNPLLATGISLFEGNLPLHFLKSCTHAHFRPTSRWNFALLQFEACTAQRNQTSFALRGTVFWALIVRSVPWSYFVKPGKSSLLHFLLLLTEILNAIPLELYFYVSSSFLIDGTLQSVYRVQSTILCNIAGCKGI